jgi:hypothetical protein
MSDTQERFHFARLSLAEYVDDLQQLHLPLFGDASAEDIADTEDIMDELFGALR